MTKGPPQNANCSFWNGLLGYGPTWRQNLLYFFPAAVQLGCDVQLLVHVVKLCSLDLHVLSYLRWKRWAVPPMLSPSWRCQSQVWSVHQLTSQALWKESIMSAACSIPDSHQQLHRCSQRSPAGQGEVWGLAWSRGAESKRCSRIKSACGASDQLIHFQHYHIHQCCIKQSTKLQLYLIFFFNNFF